MPTAKKAVTSEIKGQSDDSEGTVASKPAKKIAKKNDLIDVAPESDNDPVAMIKMTDVVVFMKSGYSYTGPGVQFTRGDPFQRMDAIDAQRLISSMPRRFTLATREQIEKFYSLG